MAEKAGTLDRLTISADDSSYTELEFLPGPSLGFQEQFIATQGLRGHYDEFAARTRKGVGQVQGSVNFAPNAAELDLLLAWVVCQAKSGNNFTPKTTTPSAAEASRYLRAARDGDWDLYSGVYVQQATFQCSEGSPLTLGLGLVGTSETTGSTVPGTLTAVDDAEGPYVMTDCVLTVGGTAYPFRQFTLQYANAWDVRHNNSLTPSRITLVGREVSVSLALPHGDATALYAPALGGVAVVATFTHAVQTGKSLTITMPKVQTPREPKPFGQRGQASTLAWNGVVRRQNTSTALVTFAHDSSA